MDTATKPITSANKNISLIEQRFPFVIVLLKGLGQIMLQECAYTGLFFLAGIFYGSVTMGLGALLAVICGTLTAQLLGYDKTATDQGIYGFSAALVGVALTFYFDATVVVWLAVVVGSAMATILQHWFSVKKIPAFTFPFIVVTWIIMYVFQHVYPVAPSVFLSAPSNIENGFAFGLLGYGQVIFQGSVFAGAAFFIGVFVSSPLRGLYGLVASVIAGILAAAYGVPAEAIAMGLFGYNAVLCAIVFAGDKIKDGIWVLTAIVLSLVVSVVFSANEITPLTFPFVAGTWVALILQNIYARFTSYKLKEII